MSGKVSKLSLQARPSNLSENIELALRQEIRAAQAAQSQLLKWKVLAVAVIGALSLGLDGVFGSSSPRGAEENRFLLLVLLPFVCSYCDLRVVHYMLSCTTIGAFIKASYAAGGGRLLDYEGFVFLRRLAEDEDGGEQATADAEDARTEPVLRPRMEPDPLRLEMVAVTSSTVFLDTVIFLLAFGSAFRVPWLPDLDRFAESALLASSLAGLVATRSVLSWYRKGVQELKTRSIYR